MQTSEQKAFLDAIFTRAQKLDSNYLGLIEIRALFDNDNLKDWAVADGQAARKITFTNNVDDALRILDYRHDEQYTPFVGVLPRIGKYMTKSGVKKASVLWADYDFGTDKSLQTLDAALKTKELPAQLRTPGMVVSTGNGVHLYWFLDDVVPAAVAEYNNKVISKILDSDKTFDASRIMRVPGYYNRKDLSDIKLTKLVKCEPTLTVPTSVLKEPEEQAVYASVAESVFTHVASSTMSALPFLWQRYIEQGIAADRRGYYRGDRSALDFAVARELAKRGFNYHDIVAVFTDPTNGISAKTLSKEGNAREAYLRCTITKAMRQVGLELGHYELSSQ